ncbi:cation transporter, partial [Patescibacteria group bacterium]|nr:cation transporter [Patescibacteria group bacterium]
MKKITIKIQGMHCASCAANITHALEKGNGIISANVNYALEEAMVEYDERQTGLVDIHQIIKDQGYKVMQEMDHKHGHDHHYENEKNVLRRVLVSAVFTIPAFILSMFMIRIPGSILDIGISIWLQAVFTTI